MNDFGFRNFCTFFNGQITDFFRRRMITFYVTDGVGGAVILEVAVLLGLLLVLLILVQVLRVHVHQLHEPDR